MNPLIRKLSEDGTEKESRTYTIRARPEHLDQIEQLFRWMNSTASGHSGTAQISIDGDGAARVNVERKDGELDDAEIEPNCSGKVEFKVSLD